MEVRNWCTAPTPDRAGSFLSIALEQWEVALDLTLEYCRGRGHTLAATVTDMTQSWKRVARES